MIVFCDLNKELCDKIKALKVSGIKVFNKDVLKLKKQEGYKDYKIVTASNPSFSAGAGLDKSLKEAYPTEWVKAKEFDFTTNLFFVVSVNENIRTTEMIILRALAGVFAYRNNRLILTGIGTSIGGFSVDDFVSLFKRVFKNNDLSDSDLSDSKLSYSNLSDSNLSYSNLSDSNLSYSNLSDSNLSDSNLSDSNLSYSNLNHSNLNHSNLSDSKLSYSNLSDSNLSDSNLSDSNLNHSNLSDSDLSHSNLSRAKGLNYPIDYLKQFKHNKDGVIVYKAFGETYYNKPETWDVKEGSVIEENVNWNLTDSCGCGVNFATLEWIKKEFVNKNVTVWECLIAYDDLPFVIIPFGTDGKARCYRLKLLRRLEAKGLDGENK